METLLMEEDLFSTDNELCPILKIRLRETTKGPKGLGVENNNQILFSVDRARLVNGNPPEFRF